MLDCMLGVAVVEKDPNVAAKDIRCWGVADVCLKLAA
jgi:hypothetical protein